MPPSSFLLLPLSLLLLSTAPSGAAEWWVYENLGPEPVLGVPVGGFVDAVGEVGGPVMLTHALVSPGDGYVVESWTNRTFLFDGTNLTGVLATSTVREGSRAPLSDVAAITYAPAVPLLANQSWDATVQMRLRTHRSDGTATWDPSDANASVAMRLELSTLGVRWVSGPTTSTWVLGAGWASAFDLDGSRLRLVGTGFGGDFDQDGLADAADDDRDGDGVPNGTDADSDNDRISDADEARLGTDATDPRSRPADLDADGHADGDDLDDDGDGWRDDCDPNLGSRDGVGAGNPRIGEERGDGDGDGVPDGRDADWDDDCRPDAASRGGKGTPAAGFVLVGAAIAASGLVARRKAYDGHSLALIRSDSFRKSGGLK